MQIIFEIECWMYPVKLRFGVGIGEISTDIIREMSIGADGPGYYNARTAIEILKNDEKRNQTNPADIRFEITGDNQASTTMINIILSLMTVIKGNMDRKAKGDYLEYDGTSR